MDTSSPAPRPLRGGRPKTPRTPPDVERVLNINETTFDLLTQVRDKLLFPPEDFSPTAVSMMAAVKCCFNAEDAHADLVLTTGNVFVSKKGAGLYATTRSTMPIPRGKRVYFEVAYADQIGSAGICVGICTKGLALNALVGADGESLGFYSSGDYYSKKSWHNYAAEWGAGAVIGCLVLLKACSADDGSQCIEADINFCVDGKFCGACPPLKVPADVELYAALSLRAQHSQAIGHFASEAMQFLHCLPMGTVGMCGTVLPQHAPSET